MKELWLIRHGETDWNQQSRWQGHTDIPLNEAGRRQAHALRIRLEQESFSAILSSDLQRAAETASIAFPAATISFDNRLREMNFGSWEGRLWSEVEKMDPQGVKNWMANPYLVRPPNGESFDELAARIVSWIPDQKGKGRVAIVTHGGVIRAFLRKIAGFQQDRYELGNCGISRLQFKEEHVAILEMNDCSHLAT